MLLVFLTFAVGAGIDIPFHDNDLRIDGLLDEPPWQSARAIEAFGMRFPAIAEGQPRYTTTAYVHHTAAGLYVGFHCQQPRAEQIARTYARDAAGQGDKVFVNLDVEGTAQRGYYFLIGSGGHLEDGTIRGEKVFSKDWDGPWRAATHLDEFFWSAECFFPWDMFSGVAEDGDGRFVRLFLSRWVESAREEYSWPQILDNDVRHLSLFQTVSLHPGVEAKGLWISPYASSAALLNDETVTERAGLDLTWQPSPSFGLTATANPDFSQVESDDVVINLGAFETFFEEKRPFFLKDQAFFESELLNFFYSRRIGAGSPGLAGDLRGALKGTGSRAGTSAGMIAARADYESRESGLDAGHADFYLGSLKRETRSETFQNAWTASAAATEAYRGMSLAHGLESRDGRISLDSQVILTENGEREGWAGSTRFTWAPRRGLRHTIQATYLDRRVDYNPLGFMRRNDERTLIYTLGKDWVDMPGVRLVNVEGQLVYGENFAGQRLFNTGSLLGYATMENGQVWQFSYRQTGPVFEDRISRGSGSVAYDSGYYTWAAWRSDTRRKFGIRLYAARGSEPLGRGANAGQVTLYLHPVSGLDVSLAVGPSARKGYLFWEEARRFSHHDVDELNTNLRLSWVINPKQELRTIFQYSSFESTFLRESILAEDGSGELFPVAGSGAGPLNIGQLSFQVRYRYEIQPLSNLYLVYARGGGTFDRQRELSFSNTWQDPDDDSFLLKVNYLFK